MPSLRLLPLVMLASAGGLASAEAHKLKVFATAVGQDVQGYAYFSPGGRAQDADVTVALADGSVIQHLKTDSDGDFHFTATRQAQHTILVDAGDGHEATYHLPADEIGTVASPPAVTSSAPGAPAASAALSPVPALSEAQIAALVDQALARQLRPLREQIDAWQEKIWFHDVLGGLGTILGLGGLVFGLTGPRRRSERAEKAQRLEEARR